MTKGRLSITLLAIICWIGVSYPVRAAQITLDHDETRGVAVIRIEGEIAAGDAVSFGLIAKGSERALVSLASDGGELSEMLLIASVVRQRGFPTFTQPWRRCESACALIWAAGRHRFVGEGSRLGFHSSWNGVNGLQQADAGGNVRIAAYLGSLGYSRQAIEFMTDAPPLAMKYLYPEDASRLGISATFGADLDDILAAMDAQP